VTNSPRQYSPSVLKLDVDDTDDVPVDENWLLNFDNDDEKIDELNEVLQGHLLLQQQD
jgi:hypothetical protein